VSAVPQATIRPCKPPDLPALYAVCLATGDAGEDASHLHADPELLGHLYVGPYVTLEPGLAFALEDDVGVAGYVLGAADSDDFSRRMEAEWLPPLRTRYPAPAGDSSGWDPDEQLIAQLHHPPAARHPALADIPAHLHIDLLPRAQGRGYGRRMMQQLFEALRARGVPSVFLGVATRNLRAIGFYQKLQFELRAVSSGGTTWMVRDL